MGFSVKLCQNNSPAEKINKDIVIGLDISGCVLKDQTSILRPTIRILTTSDIHTYNYMYIPEFERYYYIDDIVSINNNLWEVSGHVDVLETYKNSILSQEAVIRRQENIYNLYLNDPDFITYNNDKIQTLKFKNGTGFSKNLTYALVVNGS